MLGRLRSFQRGTVYLCRSTGHKLQAVNFGGLKKILSIGGPRATQIRIGQILTQVKFRGLQGFLKQVMLRQSDIISIGLM